MICKNHESGKYQALAMYVSANKNQNLLKNLNLLCNPSVFREGGYCVIEEFKGTSAGSVCAMPRNVECMNASVGVGDQLCQPQPRLSGA